MFKKYGETNVSKVPEVMDKILKNSKKGKDYQLPSGKIIHLQGYEPRAYDFLLYYEKLTEDQIISNRKDVPKIYWKDNENKEHRYFVDFYIPIQNRLIEVKSDYLYYRDMEEIFAKRDACIQNGYLFDIYVFNEKEFLMIT